MPTHGQLPDVVASEVDNMRDIDKLVHGCMLEGLHRSNILRLLSKNLRRLRRFVSRFLSAWMEGYRGRVLISKER